VIKFGYSTPKNGVHATRGRGEAAIPHFHSAHVVVRMMSVKQPYCNVNALLVGGGRANIGRKSERCKREKQHYQRDSGKADLAEQRPFVTAKATRHKL